MEPLGLRVAWGFGYGGSSGVTAIFVTWVEVNTRKLMHAFASDQP